MMRQSLLLSCLSLASCAAPLPGQPPDLVGLPRASAPLAAVSAQRQEPFASERRPAFAWQPGEPLMQGFLGVTYFQDVTVGDGGAGEVDGDEGDLDQLPLLGGGAQWKFGGRRLDLGLEGLLSFAGRANAKAFVVGGGGAAVAVDVDLLIFELFGGPFVSLRLGDKLRLYGAAGPLLQWANYDQAGGGLSDSGSGFGSGLYARTGFEFLLPSRSLLGFGLRWSDTSVDLGGGLGDLEIDGLQAVLTVSRGS